MPAFDKVVLISRKTVQQELVERYNTRSQAKFMLQRHGDTFSLVESTHANYQMSLEQLKAALPRGVRLQEVERGFLANFQFGPRDLVVTLGPDGLVVNTAKYLGNQPLLAFNPDPARIDGILVPFKALHAARWFPLALEGKLGSRAITMAVARLDDGQLLYAVNDLFIGQKSHVSARYRIGYRGRSEVQSSSGIIVSTGAGSTGWFRSVLTGAAGISAKFTDHFPESEVRERYGFDPTADELRFSVREPFISRTSSAGIIYGQLTGHETLEISSQMPHNGVIFSDGVENDYLSFESGRVATVGVADRKVNLLIPQA